jgi:hypothetical protein
VDGSQGHSSVRGEGRTPILILMGATAMVLLIAMANAANLLLARSAQRRRELAIRAAIGAGRGELMAQLLMEAWDGARASAAATLKDESASPPGRAARHGFTARWCAPT